MRGAYATKEPTEAPTQYYEERVKIRGIPKVFIEKGANFDYELTLRTDGSCSVSAGHDVAQETPTRFERWRIDTMVKSFVQSTRYVFRANGIQFPSVESAVKYALRHKGAKRQ